MRVAGWTNGHTVGMSGQTDRQPSPSIAPRIPGGGGRVAQGRDPKCAEGQTNRQTDRHRGRTNRRRDGRAVGGVTYEAVGLQGSGAAPRALLMAALVGRPPEAAPIALRRTDGLRHCGESSERGGGQRPKNPPVDPPPKPPGTHTAGSHRVPAPSSAHRSSRGTGRLWDRAQGVGGGGVVRVRVGFVWVWGQRGEGDQCGGSLGGVGSVWGLYGVRGSVRGVGSLWGVGQCGVCVGSVWDHGGLWGHRGSCGVHVRKGGQCGITVRRGSERGLHGVGAQGVRRPTHTLCRCPPPRAPAGGPA